MGVTYLPRMRRGLDTLSREGTDGTPALVRRDTRVGLCCKHEVCAGLCDKWRAGTRAGTLPAASTPGVPELTPEWVKRENCYVLTRNGDKGAQGEVVKIDTLTMDPWADTHDQTVQNPLFQLPENPGWLLCGFRQALLRSINFMADG